MREVRDQNVFSAGTQTHAAARTAPPVAKHGLNARLDVCHAVLHNVSILLIAREVVLERGRQRVIKFVLSVATELKHGHDKEEHGLLRRALHAAHAAVHVNLGAAEERGELVAREAFELDNLEVGPPWREPLPEHDKHAVRAFVVDKHEVLFHAAQLFGARWHVGPLGRMHELPE